MHEIQTQQPDRGQPFSLRHGREVGLAAPAEFMHRTAERGHDPHGVVVGGHRTALATDQDRQAHGHAIGHAFIDTHVLLVELGEGQDLGRLERIRQIADVPRNLDEQAFGIRYVGQIAAIQ